MSFNQKQANQSNNSTNNTTASLNVEKITQEDVSSSSSNSGSASNGIHKVHLNGGDVAVDSNGRVVGHYYPNGEYIQGGQLEGMSIDEAKAFDEQASKHGMK